MLGVLARGGRFPDILVATVLAGRVDRDQEHFWSVPVCPIQEIGGIGQSGVRCDDPGGVVWQSPESFPLADRDPEPADKAQVASAVLPLNGLAPRWFVSHEARGDDWFLHQSPLPVACG